MFNRINKANPKPIAAVIGAALITAAAVVPAHAVTCSYTSQTGAAAYLPSVTMGSWANISSQMFSGDSVSQANLRNGIAYVNNDTGAIMLNLDGSKIGGGVNFEQMSSAPAVFAYYDPDSGVGRIFVDRAIHLTNNHLVLQEIPFAPKDGSVLSMAYMGTNPFWQFVQGVNGNPTVPNPNAFVKVTAPAFYTAVGLVMRHFHATRGWIASMALNSSTSTSSHTSNYGTSKTTTTTVTYTTKPKWTMVVPSGAAPNAYTLSYTVPVCTGPNSLLTASSTTQAKSSVQLMMTPLTQGAAAGTTYNGNAVGGLTVYSGFGYVDQGSNPVGLQTGSWQIYQHSESASGLTGFGTILNLANPVWQFQNLAHGGLKSVLAGISTAINTSTGGLTNLFGNSPNGQYSFSTSQANTPSSTAVSAYKQSLGSTEPTSGQATSSTAPDSDNPNQNSGWTGGVGALTKIVSTPQTQVGHSLGTQAVTVLNNTPNNVPSQPMSSTSSQYYSTTATSPLGNLPEMPPP